MRFWYLISIRILLRVYGQKTKETSLFLVSKR
jgi:hypothetical protein